MTTIAASAFRLKTVGYNAGQRELYGYRHNGPGWLIACAVAGRAHLLYPPRNYDASHLARCADQYDWWAVQLAVWQRRGL